VIHLDGDGEAHDRFSGLASPLFALCGVSDQWVPNFCWHDNPPQTAAAKYICLKRVSNVPQTQAKLNSGLNSARQDAGRHAVNNIEEIPWAGLLQQRRGPG
jgi:hypothetical protein